MSERGYWQKAYNAYVNSGTTWTPVKQLHFFDRVSTPPEYPVVCDRTIGDFFGEDFSFTVGALRHLYVPGLGRDEKNILHHSLVGSLSWLLVEGNRKTFDQAGEFGNFDVLPLAVLLNYHTLHFLQVGFESDLAGVVCAVDPRDGDGEFDADVRSLTWRHVEKIKTTEYELGKKLNPRLHSSSRVLKMLIELFWNVDCGLERFEAIDLLTWELLKTYYLGLRERAKRTFGK